MTGLLATALIGCTKTEKIYIDEMYQKAYITSDFYPQNESTLCVVKDSFTDPFLEIRNNRLVYSAGFVHSISGSKHSSFYFRTIYPVKSEVTATLVVDEDALAAYNKEHGLSGEEAYQLLPAEFYTITQATSTIEVGESQGNEIFAVDINENLDGLADGLYLLPLTVEMDNAAFELSSTRGYYYIPLEYSVEDERTGDSSVPTNLKLLVSNTDFTLEETTAKEDLYMGVGDYYYDSGFYSLSGLFDNNGSTVAGTVVANATVDVIFNEPVYIDRISFANTAAYDSSTYESKPFEVQISCLYEEETAFSQAVTVLCEDADLYWFDAAAKLNANKRVEQISIKIADVNAMCSDICFVVLAE